MTLQWGKFIWTTIHVVALGFPEVVTDVARKQYRDFYANIGNVLPCSKCRVNYVKHFKDLPIDLFLFDRHSLFSWTVQLHNIVNVETHKPEWSVEEALEFYKKGKYAEKKEVTHNVNAKILVFLNIALLIALIAMISHKFLARK